MFPYLTLHDATQTRNKNLLISHCYLTLELGTRLSLVTITRTSHRNTKLARACFRPQMWGESLFICWQEPIIGGCWHHPMCPGARPLSRYLVVTWLPGARPAPSWHQAQTLTRPGGHSQLLTSFAQHCFNSHDIELFDYCIEFVVLTQPMDDRVDHDWLCWGCCEQVEQF